MAVKRNSSLPCSIPSLLEAYEFDAVILDILLNLLATESCCDVLAVSAIILFRILEVDAFHLGIGDCWMFDDPVGMSFLHLLNQV